MRFNVMGLNVMNFRVMRLGAPPAAAPGAAAVPAGLPAPGREDIGRPTAQSQQAGLDHLTRIAMEQAAAEARRRIPAQLTTLSIREYHPG